MTIEGSKSIHKYLNLREKEQIRLKNLSITFIYEEL